MSVPNVGIKEIAAAAGVSIATVSRHLSGKTIRPAYRERVEKALSRLYYRPNLAARRLRSNDAAPIGLVVPDIGNPFFVALIREIESLAWHDGRRVILCNSNEDPGREARLLPMLEDERVSGIIIASAVGSTPPDASVPMVLVDRGVAEPRHDVVLLDNANAAAALVDALVDAGHRRILGLFGQWGVTAAERRQGFDDRLRAHGLPARTIPIPDDPNGRHDAIRDAIDRNQMDAVVCGDSLVLLDAAIAIGETARSHVRLAGFDTAAWLPLSRNAPIIVAQPIEEMAHAAFALLTSRMAGNDGDPVTIAFKGDIVMGPDRQASAGDDDDRRDMECRALQGSRKPTAGSSA